MVPPSAPGGEPACLEEIERDMVYLRVKNRPRPIVLAYAGLAAPQKPATVAPRAAPADDLAGLLKKGLEQNPTLMGLGGGGGGVSSLLDIIKMMPMGGLAQ